MRVYRSAVFALVAFTVGALPARAQDARPVEVTPYVAVGSAGASPVGTAVTFPVTSTLSVETDMAYRRGEGRIHALSTSASLLYSLPRLGQTTPYVAGGVGLADESRADLDLGTLDSAAGRISFLPTDRLAVQVSAARM